MDEVLETGSRRGLEANRTRTPPPEAVPVPPIPVARYTSAEFFELERGQAWRLAGSSPPTSPTCPHPVITTLRTHRCTHRAGARRGQRSGRSTTVAVTAAPVVREACGTSKRLTCPGTTRGPTDSTASSRAVPDERSFSGWTPTRWDWCRFAAETWRGWIFVNEDRWQRHWRTTSDHCANRWRRSTDRRCGGSEVRSTVWMPTGRPSWTPAEVYHIRAVHPDNGPSL